MFKVCEFYGNGDAMFGGSGDDRPLGVDGEFLSGWYSWSDVAVFNSETAAQTAIDSAKKRAGGIVSIIREPS